MHQYHIYIKESYTRLPSSFGQAFSIGHLVDIDSDHGFSKIHAHLSKNLWILEVCDGLDNSLCSLCCIPGLEDTTTYKNSIASQLHHKCSISWCSYPSCSEVYYW